MLFLETLLFSALRIFYIFISLAVILFLLYLSAYIFIPVILIGGILYIIRQFKKYEYIKITPSITITPKKKEKKQQDSNIIDVDYTEIK